MKTSVRAAVEVMFQRRRQCLTAGQVLINRDYAQNPSIVTWKLVSVSVDCCRERSPTAAPINPPLAAAASTCDVDSTFRGITAFRNRSCRLGSGLHWADDLSVADLPQNGSRNAAAFPLAGRHNTRPFRCLACT